MRFSIGHIDSRVIVVDDKIYTADHHPHSPIIEDTLYRIYRKNERSMYKSTFQRILCLYVLYRIEKMIKIYIYSITSELRNSKRVVFHILYTS